MQNHVQRLAVLAVFAVIPIGVGSWLLWDWQRYPAPLEMDFLDFASNAPNRSWVEVKNCVPDYEHGFAIYEQKNKRILSSYVPLRAQGQADNRVVALLQIDTSKQSFWVGEGLTLPFDEEIEPGTPQDEPRATPGKTRSEGVTYRGMVSDLSGEHASLINRGNAGWQVSPNCRVLRENKSPEPWAGVAVLGFGTVMGLLLTYFLYVTPWLAARRRARAEGLQPRALTAPLSPVAAHKPLPVMPAAFGPPPVGAPVSPMLGQFRILLYPVVVVLVLAIGWAGYEWAMYLRNTEPDVFALKDYSPETTDSNWLELQQSHVDLTMTIVVFQPTTSIDKEDTLDYYVPITEGPNDEKRIRAFLHLSAGTDKIVVARGLEKFREDGAGAHKYANEVGSRLEYSGTLSGTTDWGHHRSSATRDLLSMQFEGYVDPDFVIINEDEKPSLIEPVLSTLPVLICGVLAFLLMLKMRRIANAPPTQYAPRAHPALMAYPAPKAYPTPIPAPRQNRMPPKGNQTPG